MCKRKNVLLIIFTFILSCGLLLGSGCAKDSEGEKEYSIDVNALSAELIEKVKFDGQMNDVVDYLAVNFIVEEGVTGVSFKASSALADEITIFTAPNEDVAKKMLNNVKLYVGERKNLFADYAAEEAAKLEKAVVIQKGKYVVLCVSDDADNAKAIINKAF